MRFWIASHGIDENFSATQFSNQGLCHPSAFSRSKALLVRAGLIKQVSGSRKPSRPRKGDGVAALYIFTDEAYLLVLGNNHRRAKCTPPLGFGEIVGTPQYKQEQEAPEPAVAVPHREDVAKTETIEAMLIQDGFVGRGARALASFLGSRVEKDLVPYLLEATKAVVSKRRLARSSPEPLKYHIIKSLDQSMMVTARRLQRESANLLGSHEGLRECLRRVPKLTKPLDGWVQWQERLRLLPCDHPETLPLGDEVRRCRQEAHAAILEAAGPEMREEWASAALRAAQGCGYDPNSLLWKRTFNLHHQQAAFAWAGIPSDLVVVPKPNLRIQPS